MTESERGYNEMKMFAFFGRTIYNAQTIEAIMATCIMIHIVKNERITKARYDELFYEKTRQTFGQLKRQIIALKVFTEEELEKIDKAHVMRDYLSHNYLADRVVEFQKQEHWNKVIEELSHQWDYFMEVYKIIETKVIDFISEYPHIDLKGIEEKLLSEESTPEIEKFRELNKNETVTDIFTYDILPDFNIPIFQLEDGTHWTISERGLSQYKVQIDPLKIKRLKEVEDIFPIRQFNPRPRIESAWNYALDLKVKGLLLKITPAEGLHFKWKILKK